MLAIDISDSSIEVLDIKKTLTSKFKIEGINRTEIESGIVENFEVKRQDLLVISLQKVLKEASPKAIKRKSCIVLLPEIKVGIHRATFDASLSKKELDKAIEEKVKEVFPFAPDEIIAHIKVVNKTGRFKDVLFIATPIILGKDLINIFNQAGLNITGFINESYALYNLFKANIEDEETMLLDIGAKFSVVHLFDRYGPYFSLNEPVETKSLIFKLKELLEFFQKENIKLPRKLILAGGGSINSKPFLFEKELNLTTILASNLLSIKQERLKLNFGEFEAVVFANTFGALELFYQNEYIEVEDFDIQQNIQEAKGISSQTSVAEAELPKQKEKDLVSYEYNRNKFFLFAFFGFAIVLIFAFFIFGKNLLKEPSSPAEFQVTPVISPKVEETVQPQSAIKREDVKLRILNGTGEPGLAAKVKDDLEQVGYKNIETGNADHYNYLKSEIHYKSGKKEEASLIADDLKNKYEIDTKTEITDKDTVEDIIFIIGRR